MSSRVPLPLSPFQRLGRLIAGIEPGRPPIDVSVGEPRHPVPGFVGPVLAAALADFVRYPPIKGTPAFRAAVADWAEKRFALADGAIDRDDGVLPLNGSREGLFHATLTAVRLAGDAKGPRPAILLPNPFYEAALRPLTGCDAPVAQYLAEHGSEQRMQTHILAFLQAWLPDMSAEHRSYVNVAIGCTGGQHRSVYLVEQLQALLQQDWTVIKRHREIQR